MSRSGPSGLDPAPLPGEVLETLRHLRFQMQGHHDTVERLAEDLNRQGTASCRDLAALLECLLADRLAPTVQNLTAIEEAHGSPGEPQC